MTNWPLLAIRPILPCGFNIVNRIDIVCLFNVEATVWDPGIDFWYSMSDEWIFVYAPTLSVMNERKNKEIRKSCLFQTSHSNSSGTWFQFFGFFADFWWGKQKSVNYWRYSVENVHLPVMPLAWNSLETVRLIIFGFI